MGTCPDDFDFEFNLSRFVKRTVATQLETEDLILPEPFCCDKVRTVHAKLW